MNNLLVNWLDKRPRRGLKPWSPVAGGGIMVLHINPTVRVAEEKKLTCCFLNETGGLIWKLCDGKRSVSDMIAEVAAHYGVSEDVVSQDVCRLLDQLRAAALVQVDDDSFF